MTRRRIIVRSFLIAVLAVACVALWLDRGVESRSDQRPDSLRPSTPVLAPQLPPERAASDDEDYPPHIRAELERAQKEAEAAPLERLRGRITDVSGGPIAGATITAYPLFVFTTDTNGDYVAALPAGAHVIDVDAQSYASARREARVPGELNVQLYPEATIEARIVQGDTENPVPGAYVLLNGTRSTYANDLGELRFDALHPGQYHLTARAENWASPPETEIDLDAGETKQVILRARPAFSVRATVIDEATKQPCPKTYVVLKSAVSIAEVRGDPQGQVTLGGLLPDRYEVKVSCIDRGTFAPADVFITNRSVSDLIWTLPRGRSIRGRVLNEDGTPVKEGRVVAVGLGDDKHAMSSAPCDDQGRFELRSVQEGSYSIFAALGATFTSTVVRVGSRDVDGVILRSPPPAAEAELSGEVLTADGKPVANFVLTIETPSSRARVQATTDAAGHFSARVHGKHLGLRLPEGSDLVLAGGRTVEYVELDPTKRKRVRLVVTKAEHTIRVQVVGAAGQPISGSTVVAVFDDDARDQLFAGINEGWVEPSAKALSDSDGFANLTELTADLFAIRAQGAGGNQAIARKVRAPGRLVLKIPAAGAISGHVVHLHRPGTPAIIVARHVTDELERTVERASPDGAFTIGELSPGRYRLIAQADGLGAFREVELASGQHLSGIELAMTRSVSVRGRLGVAGSERPLADCHVDLRGGATFAFGKTDADGAFVFNNVGPGPRVLGHNCVDNMDTVYCGPEVSFAVREAADTELGSILLSPDACEDR